MLPSNISYKSWNYIAEFIELFKIFDLYTVFNVQIEIA